MSGRHRTPVLFVTWSFVQGRAAEISGALGGDVCAIYPQRLSGSRRAPLRYIVSSFLTAWALIRRRPRSVIVTNPPIFPALIVYLYGLVASAPVLLDSHPTSFGAKDNKVAQRFLPVHRWLARRVAVVLVTTDDWVQEVERWGGRGMVLHEAPPLWTVSPATPLTDRPVVLFVGIFASDEPVDEVVEAARSTPEIDVQITGHVDRAPGGLVESAPANVTFLGYLGPADYRSAVESADLLLALTTERTSVMRAAYEGVYAGRPIIISDWPVLRELFPEAVHVHNDATSIAAGLRAAVEGHAELLANAELARRLQESRWDSQIEELAEIARISIPHGAAGAN